VFERVEDYAAYAGIGSRETPGNILGLMRGIARMLADRGYTLRSGGAKGADQAFEYGTPVLVQMEIFVPWHGFERRPQTIPDSKLALGEARSIAEKFHPNWEACSEGARKMHTRNTFQVLGADCHTPSKFVVCWTKDGKASGGTGQTLRIAEAHKIPIYNLHDPNVRAMFYGELGWEHDV
jgi:hypothetical protein